ncbi:Z-ring associated protein ZapG [Candidatus Enterovibrio escicola]|uniref:Z-ring associated protein G n=1 Tax=Candidatus Enterovibrio escicola TaxID=1927127 RepID=A0A2A5T5C6_9GAMM|nr:Z-ring associated protein ZapG [Candidatus Enterovibrio escacola]PCS23346.1 putative cytochrome d ubiquinol oxidase subunit III [Candidatus Enterovibrio escacola]
MTWINSLVFMIIGMVIGFLVSRLTICSNSHQKGLRKELEKSRYELEQYRQELVDHFAQSANLLDNIYRDYSRLYQHLATTTAELMPNLPEQDNPFAKRVSKLSDISIEQKVPQEPPRDYSDKSTGILGNANKTGTIS